MKTTAKAGVTRASVADPSALRKSSSMMACQRPRKRLYLPYRPRGGQQGTYLDVRSGPWPRQPVANQLTRGSEAAATRQTRRVAERFHAQSRQCLPFRFQRACLGPHIARLEQGYAPTTPCMHRGHHYSRDKSLITRTPEKYGNDPNTSRV